MVTLACSRRSDSRARRSVGSELNCFFLRELFSRALLSECLTLLLSDVVDFAMLPGSSRSEILAGYSSIVRCHVTLK